MQPLVKLLGRSDRMRMWTSSHSFRLMSLIVFCLGLLCARSDSAGVATNFNSPSVGADGNNNLLLSDATQNITLAALLATLSNLTTAQQQTASQVVQLTREKDLLQQRLAAVVSDTCAAAANPYYTTTQSINTKGADEWEFFTMNNQSYLAVANHFDGGSWAINSQIFVFNGTSFVLFQNIATVGASGVEWFSINDQHYLAIANSNDNSINYAVNSHIYKFQAATSSFVLYQSIPTQCAQKFRYFSINNESYLAQLLLQVVLRSRTSSSSTAHRLYSSRIQHAGQ